MLDLSDNARELLHPQSYFRIPNPEDRLFVNAEHAPLFDEKGWSVPPCEERKGQPPVGVPNRCRPCDRRI